MNQLTILDGGMGRELKRIGAPFSQPLWSAEALIKSPQYVEQAHQNFIDAGAQIITTNSYACVPFHLGQQGFDTSGFELAQKAAKIARACADNAPHKVQVAATLPPALGSYRPDLFEPQQAKSILTTLFDAQAPYIDIWLAETISSLEELAVIHAIVTHSEKPCFYSFSLDDSAVQKPLLRSKQSVRDAVTQVCQLGGEGVFFNCSVPEVMLGAVKEAKQVIDELGCAIEIGVYANNFAPIDTKHAANQTIQAMRELSPQEYLTYCQTWAQHGASILGGCCGIEPQHIKALRDWQAEVEG